MAKTKKTKANASRKRYWAEDHRTSNKTRRILKNNGEKFLASWKRSNA